MSDFIENLQQKAVYPASTQQVLRYKSNTAVADYISV